MEIILKEDVAGLGEQGDIVNVKPGYARNFLIPKGVAINATASARKERDETIRQRQHKEAKLKAEAEALAAKMEGVKLTIGAKTSSSGKIFGSVNAIQIAEALAAKGFDIDRKRIALPQDAVKEVGAYKANIKLHREVTVEVEFEVVSE